MTHIAADTNVKIKRDLFVRFEKKFVGDTLMAADTGQACKFTYTKYCGNKAPCPDCPFGGKSSDKVQHSANGAQKKDVETVKSHPPPPPAS